MLLTFAVWLLKTGITQGDVYKGASFYLPRSVRGVRSSLCNFA
jgi:hypothetical protein